ncbi:hypothetical protein PN478_08350 [Dolichospermum circinale CS-534/05]|uniref:hypothetical protein n=1 Tax=Dolichospermum circinale TaxID=109265 RepID=UPI00232AB7CF|nr:hypothetical protein [Dolichospermum circinale]MDB9490529.1 hypothetical protein [Dolichospermum circinale CS-534/05]
MECEIELIVYRNIEVGEEITANYNGSPENQSPIWFDVVEEISPIKVKNEKLITEIYGVIYWSML